MNEEHLAKVNSKSKEKISAVQMARTGVLLAPKQQLHVDLPPQMARTGLLQHVHDQSLAPTPTACVTSAEMALGLRQTSHSAGHWRFLPPFFFCGCWCKFFFNAPCFGNNLSPTNLLTLCKNDVVHNTMSNTLLSRVHKNKSMQHHTLGSGTAKFQVT